MTIKVLVKGNKFEAAKAAADRNIPFTFLSESIERNRAETYGLVPSSSIYLVIEWYTEERPADPKPFPIGSCLFYVDNRPEIR